MAYEANQTLCETPLPDSEFETIWKSAQNYIPTQQQDKQSATAAATAAPFKELEGSKYYRINVKPQRFIIAHSQRKQLIEAIARSKTKESITNLQAVTQ